MIGESDINGIEIKVGDKIRFTFFYYAGYEIITYRVGIVKMYRNIPCFYITKNEYYYFRDLNYDAGSDIEII